MKLRTTMFGMVLVGALFGGGLPIDPQFGVYPAPLALAAVFGILV